LFPGALSFGSDSEVRTSAAKGFSDMTKAANAIIGACGEFYVAAYLSVHGFVVAVPRGGTPTCDLLVTNEKGGHAICLQVKTGKKAHTKTKKEEYYCWHTSYSVIERDGKNLWYVYVWLNGWPDREKLPDVFFVPSNVVVERMKARRSEKKTGQFFWMYAADLEKYRGDSGLQSIRVALAASK
jgi:hypothetical protein